MVVGLLSRFSHLVYKLHCRFEVGKAENPLYGDSVPLPTIQRSQFLLDFCIRKHSHKGTLPILASSDSSVSAEKLQHTAFLQELCFQYSKAKWRRTSS